jgi:ubiquinol-cytochrome c reductase cytochrome c subunit
VKRVAAVALLLVSVSCTSDGGTYRPPGISQKGGPQSGAQLYLRDCAWCHARDGTGTDNGPNIVSGAGGAAAADFVLSTGRMPISDPEHSMKPGPTIYSDDEIDGIVAYVRGLEPDGPDVPPIDLAGADLNEGLVLYQENCAACHSTTGIGGALTQGGADRDTSPIAPHLLESTATEVAEATRIGPGTMPVFGEEVFDSEQLESIVAYVMYLQNPDDRGGASIGRIGPVAEGAIGWLVGLGLLLAFSRWIGTKRGEQ